MISYYPEKLDLMGTIRYGIRTTNLQKEFESIIREIDTELKKTKSSNPSTINITKFKNFINKLNSEIKNTQEKKIIDKTEGVLFYASK
jgi:hypothetical protein